MLPTCRLRAAYVPAVTDAYRRSLDRLAQGCEREELPADQRRSLELSFSRGLSTGWLQRQWHQLAARSAPERQRTLVLSVSGRAAAPMCLRVLAAEGLEPAQVADLQVSSDALLEPARGAPSWAGWGERPGGLAICCSSWRASSCCRWPN